MKVSDLQYKPFELECCTNDCKNKDIVKCVQPLCIDLAIHNGLVQSDQNTAHNSEYKQCSNCGEMSDFVNSVGCRHCLY